MTLNFLKLLRQAACVGTLATLLASCTYSKGETPKDDPAPCGGVTAANVSYRTDIQPMLSQHCLSCHGSNVPDPFMGGNIHLDNFPELKRYIDNGRLLRSIKHDPNGDPMPQNGAKLSDCEILIFQAWSDAGAPQN